MVLVNPCAAPKGGGADASVKDVHLAPVLILNPLTDEEFVAFARGRARATSGPADLQAQLRVRYPRAIVRQRDLSGEPTSVWYVYRDGSWTSGDKPTEG